MLAIKKYIKVLQVLFVYVKIEEKRTEAVLMLILLRIFRYMISQNLNNDIKE